MVFDFMFNHKRIISEFRDGLDRMSASKMMEYWRDHERCAYQNNYKEEINEILKNNIIPKTLADGKVFPIGRLTFISHKSVIVNIKKKKEWSESKRKRIADCYGEFINWLNTVHYNWLKEHKLFVSKFTDKLACASVITIMEYWRDYERNRRYQDNYAKEIDEIFKNNIIPKTLADGKAFTVGGLKDIGQSIIVNIKKKKEWSATKRENITNCYSEFIKWLNIISFEWFKEDFPIHNDLKKIYSIRDFAKEIDEIFKNNITSNNMVFEIVNH